ncbi:P1 family peptidase [Nonomuraea ferruginea]
MPPTPCWTWLGLRVGHHHRAGGGYRTGTTVVLAPSGGMVAGVDVRGAAPGTRETELLDPRNLVERVHAIVLTGGSAYGLSAACGVMSRLADAGVGFPVEGGVVPIVPAAVIYDLGRGGAFRATPDAAFGEAAHDAALHPAPSLTATPATGVKPARPAAPVTGHGTLHAAPGASPSARASSAADVEPSQDERCRACRPRRWSVRRVRRRCCVRAGLLHLGLGRRWRGGRRVWRGVRGERGGACERVRRRGRGCGGRRAG